MSQDGPPDAAEPSSDHEGESELQEPNAAGSEPEPREGEDSAPTDSSTETLTPESEVAESSVPTATMLEPAVAPPSAELPPLPSAQEPIPQASSQPPTNYQSSPAGASNKEMSSGATTDANSGPSYPHTATKVGSDKEEKFDGGLYFDLNFAPAFGLGSTHEWNKSCPSIGDASGTFTWNPDCKTTAPIGGLMQSNLGFRFGIVGIEAFGFFSGDYSSGKLQGEKASIPLPSYATNMQVGRIGGALGGGIRVMNNAAIRVSAAVGGGVIFRHVYTNVSSLDGTSTGYTSPVIKADLTVSLGKFLNLGIMGWIEFSKKIEVTPNLDSASSLVGSDPATDAALGAIEEGFGDVTVFDRTQYFIAPYIGFHFGK